MKNDFDPLVYVAQLKQVRVPQDQAEVHARALDAVASNCVLVRELASMGEQLQADNRAVSAICGAKIDALAAQFHEFKISVDQRFDAVDKRFDGVDKQFDGVDKQFDGVDKQFDGVNTRFDGLNKQFDGVDKRFDGVGRRLDVLEAGQLELIERVSKLETKMRWGISFLAFMNISILLKLFFP